MIRWVNFFTLILITFSSQAHGVTDWYLSSGSAKATYNESIDSQTADLIGREQSLTIRNLNSLSFIDLGMTIGSLALSGNSESDAVDFTSSHINLTAGISFSLYPSWIEYYLDQGYRFGLGKVEIQRTNCDNSISNYTFNDYVTDSTLRYGIKFMTFDRYIIGIQKEVTETLIEKTHSKLSPNIKSANSLTFFIGYRLGGKGGLQNFEDKTKGYLLRRNERKAMKNNPCRLFNACN